MSEKHEVEKRRPRRSGEIIKRLVSEFAASGVEASKFCRDHGLARSVLYRHLPRGGLGQIEPKPSARLAPVSLVGADDSEQPGSGCALVVKCVGTGPIIRAFEHDFGLTWAVSPSSIDDP